MIFLANENFPFPSISILRKEGFIVKSIGEEHFGITDKEVIQMAQKENSIILTFDRDYGELILKHAMQNPPSVAYFRLKGDTPVSAGLLILALLNEKVEFENHFTVIEQGNIRQRKY